jgi:hypothetical protein
MPESFLFMEGAPNSVIASMGADALRVINCGPEDEVCTLSMTGTFNVSALLRAIRARTVSFNRLRMPVTPALRHHLSLRDIDVPYAMILPTEKIFAPAVFILTPPPPPTMDHVAELIDGAHRITRLIAMGYREFNAECVLLADAEPFRVVHQIRKAGEWVTLSDAELLKVTWGTYTRPRS